MQTIRAFFSNVETYFFDFQKRAGEFSPHSVDILGNLRVRISDPQQKSARRKTFDIFLLETSKNDHWRGGMWGEVASALVLKSSPFTTQKCPLIRRIAFYFPEMPFCFPKVSFCFPEVPFYFSKIPHCFPELSLSFSELPSFYFLCASFLFFQLI